MTKKIVSAILVFILLIGFGANVFASLQSEKNDLQNKIDDAKEQKTKVKLEISKSLQDIEDLNDSIDDNQDKLDDLNNDLKNLSDEISQLKSELEEAEKQYDAQEDLLKDRISAQYEAGDITYLDVLLNSKGFSDFLSNYFLVSEVLENDSELLTNIENKKTKIEKDKQSLEDKQKDLKTKKAEQEKIQVLLNNQKVQKQNKVSALSDEEKNLQKSIEEYTKEINRVEKQIRDAANNAGNKYNGNISGSGVLAWPLPSSYGRSRITSYFGHREQPVAGASTYHRAIDIGVPIGTSVYAAADGYVVTTGYSSIRGNYIMVKHADNLYTFYQHLKSVAVPAGRNVSKGQTIAYSGNTGIGSGPHLHFEVRTSPNYGSEVDPLKYL